MNFAINNYDNNPNAIPNHDCSSVLQLQALKADENAQRSTQLLLSKQND